MGKQSKILTLDSLYQFFVQQNKSVNFSVENSEKPIVVSIPGNFEQSSDDMVGMLKLKLKVCHTELNRNGSYISEENIKKAIPSLKYRPLLAYIHTLPSGEDDFYAHNIEIIKDENGEEKICYLEKQVGCFTTDEPYLEYDEEMDKTYVIAHAVIPEEYTNAADIIRRKQGTKVSCELVINELAYNAKEKYLELIDFYFGGTTLLGCDEDGVEIGEGMIGSRADISEFCLEEKTYAFQEQIIEMQEKLDKLISCFNIDSSKKGGISMNHFEELLAKYSKTVEDITFEYESMSDEDLDAKFEELFGEGKTEPEDDSVVVENSDETEEVEVVEEELEMAEVVETVAENEVFTRTYELSHDDIRCALYALLVPYEEADNTYYYISEVFDSYFVYESWCNGGTIYGQGYVKDEETVSFEGERYELFRELLTASEKAELEAMRSNYAAISEKLKVYEDAETEAKKVELLNADDYASVRDSEVFAELVNDHANISYEELQSKCDQIILDAVKSGKYSAANSVDDTTKTSKKQFTNPTVKKIKPSRYGKLFAKENN
ncbi:MAG: hypothetical protein IKU53_01975 [Firmicutes bacterium]|nr:hypothetical protein [Bacillota bacterium]